MSHVVRPGAQGAVSTAEGEHGYQLRIVTMEPFSSDPFMADLEGRAVPFHIMPNQQGSFNQVVDPGYTPGEREAAQGLLHIASPQVTFSQAVDPYMTAFEHQAAFSQRSYMQETDPFMVEFEHQAMSYAFGWSHYPEVGGTVISQMAFHS